MTTLKSLITKMSVGRLKKTDLEYLVLKFVETEGDVSSEQSQCLWQQLYYADPVFRVRFGNRVNWNFKVGTLVDALVNAFKVLDVVPPESFIQTAVRNSECDLKELFAYADARFMADEICQHGFDKTLAFFNQYPELVTDERLKVIVETFKHQVCRLVKYIPRVLENEDVFQRFTSAGVREALDVIHTSTVISTQDKNRLRGFFHPKISIKGDIEECVLFGKIWPDTKDDMFNRIKDIVNPDPDKLIRRLVNGTITPEEFSKSYPSPGGKFPPCMMMMMHPMMRYMKHW